MWYIYTGLLLTSLLQLKITTRGCVSNPKTMEENYQKFNDAEQKSNDEKSISYKYNLYHYILKLKPKTK